MFDITSSKLLIRAIIALIVVGPKDLPVLLRTVGKYLGVIRRHANEFRAQFDEALREAELDQLKKDFDSVRNEVRSTIEQGSRAIESNIEKAGAEHVPKRAGPAVEPASAPQPLGDAVAELGKSAQAEPPADTRPLAESLETNANSQPAPADKTGT
jgi:sec-independent protein translocase protein TatB